MVDDDDLSQAQVDLIFEARKKDDPVVVERAARDAAASVLAADLDGLDPTADVSLEALANRWIGEDGEVDESFSLESLAQRPETGGATDDGGAAWSAGGGGLDPDDAEDVRTKLEKAQRLESRTPEFAETLRSEACSIAGVDDVEEIDVDVL